MPSCPARGNPGRKHGETDPLVQSESSAAPVFRRAARVVAVDFAEGMVEQIRARTGHDGVSNVEAAVMDAQSLDFPEASLRVMERAGAPFVALKKKLGAEGWAQAEARLLDAVRRRIPEGGADLGAEAILTVGTR
jgi:hypothetical protein